MNAEATAAVRSLRAAVGDHTMTRIRGLSSPKPSFSEERGRRTDSETTGGCHFPTPSGRCNDPGSWYEVSGVRLELCPAHLEAALQDTGHAVPPRSPTGRARRFA